MSESKTVFGRESEKVMRLQQDIEATFGEYCYHSRCERIIIRKAMITFASLAGLFILAVAVVTAYSILN